MKIFCIGFNKTGTLTLHTVLSEHFISSHDYHWKWCDYSHSLGDESLKEFLGETQCFSDGELSDFRRLDRLFPESRFILNTRPLYPWLISRVKHLYRFYPALGQGVFAQRYQDIYDESAAIRRTVVKEWVVNRNQYYHEVFDYFDACASKLLVLDVTSDGFPQVLGDFLGVEFKYDGEIHNSRPTEELDAPSQLVVASESENVRLALQEMGVSMNEYDCTGVVGPLDIKR